MHRIVPRMIVFAVRDPGSGAHPLHLAGANDGTVAQIVPVGERALQYVGDDLHVPMPVLVEAGAGQDAVLVDDAKRPETRMVGVAIAPEDRKSTRLNSSH